ncbi:MAG: hypothetical protein HY537_04665 [Deltaproteobacteria bacterium]|nr:hypothetical protein [Deltaproteobacteria bacterium]
MNSNFTKIGIGVAVIAVLGIYFLGRSNTPSTPTTVETSPTAAGGTSSPATAGQYPQAQTVTEGQGQASAPAPVIPSGPYRTFITVQRYNMENSGSSDPISNVKLEIIFPSGSKLELPGSGQYWPIGNGQSQEINRTYELPWQAINADGFKFSVQMLRKGEQYLPCNFDVKDLSQFDRSYICRTDTGWQLNKGIAEEQLDKEGIQVRIFTDRNATPAEIARTEAVKVQ